MSAEQMPEDFYRCWSAATGAGRLGTDAESVAHDMGWVLSGMLSETAGGPRTTPGGLEAKTPHDADKPETIIYGDGAEGFVRVNTFHHLSSRLLRDRESVAIETAIYAYGNAEGRSAMQWADVTKTVGEWIGSSDYHDFRESGLPDDAAHLLAGIEYGGQETGETGGPFAEFTTDFAYREVNRGTAHGPTYAIVHLDAGGGEYGPPRVFKPQTMDRSLAPSDGTFTCNGCGWTADEESTWDSPRLRFYEETNAIRDTECGGVVDYHV